MIAAISAAIAALLMPAAADAAVSFAPAVNYTLDSSTDAVEPADVDGDGDRDLVAMGRTEVTLSLNAGDGTFGGAAAVGGSLQPGNGLAVGRFNRGRARDVALVADNTDPARIAVMISRGDGTFREPRVYRAGGGPYDLAVGDFDDDGRLDIAASGGNTNRLAVLFGRGDGTFGSLRRVGVEETTYGIAAGDINGDGRDDLAAVNPNNDVSLAYGRGDRGFRVGADQAPGTQPYAVDIADLDGDGRNDIAVSNKPLVGDSYLAVLWRKPKGFDPFTSHSLGSTGAVQTLAASDLTGDGLPDPAVGFYADSVRVLENQDRRAFATAVPFSVGDGTPPPPEGVQDVEAALLDADGFRDLVTANDVDDSASVLINAAP